MCKRECLDFFVIGAQKAGTTSLYHYLKRHPGICMPNDKEAPFFSDDTAFSKGLAWYLDEYFKKRMDDQKLGTVTPSYMVYATVPERISSLCKNAKIIAILRDPLDRAESQYKMMVRAFGEKRSFQEMIDEQINAAVLKKERVTTTLVNSNIILGEYGRILSSYLQYFDRNKLLILFSEDLMKNPEKVMEKIYKFLDVDCIKFKPLKKTYNATKDGGGGFSVAKAVANLTYHKHMRVIGKSFLPEEIRRKLRFWSIINRYDPSIIGKIDVSLSQNTLPLLAHHYLVDTYELEKIAGCQIPWRFRLEAISKGVWGHDVANGN